MANRLFGASIAKLERRIAPYADHPLLPLLVFGLAFAATVIESVPVTVMLSALVVLRPRRSSTLLVTAAVGSASGAFVLATFFHAYGLPWMSSRFPSLIGSPAWMWGEQWVSRYGLFALAGAAALPVALTPFLAVCGLMRMSVAEVFVAILFGKLIKYGAVVWTVRRSAAAVFRHRETNRPAGGPP